MTNLVIIPPKAANIFVQIQPIKPTRPTAVRIATIDTTTIFTGSSKNPLGVSFLLLSPVSLVRISMIELMGVNDVGIIPSAECV